MIPVAFPNGKHGLLDLQCGSCGRPLVQVHRPCKKRNRGGSIHIHVKCINPSCVAMMPDEVRDWSACVEARPA